jgi:RNA polymerase sigma factor (sigma-70 family)
MPLVLDVERPRADARRRANHATSRVRVSPRPARRTARRRAGDRVVRLVDSASTGDDLAWAGLVAEFRSVIAAVARAHSLSETDAADVAQETWLRLFEHIQDLRSPAFVGSWLATTAGRECLRVLRLGSRQIPTDDPDHGVDDTPLDAELMTAARDTVLWRAFERLRTSDQKLLRLLIDGDEAGYREISAALWMPIGSIGPTRARALKRLRRELESDDTLDLLAA